MRAIAVAVGGGSWSFWPHGSASQHEWIHGDWWDQVRWLVRMKCGWVLECDFDRSEQGSRFPWLRCAKGWDYHAAYLVVGPSPVDASEKEGAAFFYAPLLAWQTLVWEAVQSCNTGSEVRGNHSLLHLPSLGS